MINIMTKEEELVILIRKLIVKIEESDTETALKICSWIQTLQHRYFLKRNNL